MPPGLRLVPELAHQMGLAPLAWLTALWSANVRPIAAWWALAAAFGVSWLADWAAHWFGTFPVGPLYLLVQTGMIVFVLAPHDTAMRFLAVLAGASAFAMLTLDPQQPDILVHTVAWLGLLALLWSLPLIGPLRLTLVVAFGLGWLAWLGYVLRPGWPSWLLYQGIRATSLGLFCWAAVKPSPLLRAA